MPTRRWNTPSAYPFLCLARFGLDSSAPAQNKLGKYPGTLEKWDDLFTIGPTPAPEPCSWNSSSVSPFRPYVVSKCSSKCISMFLNVSLLGLVHHQPNCTQDEHCTLLLLQLLRLVNKGTMIGRYPTTKKVALLVY